MLIKKVLPIMLGVLMLLSIGTSAAVTTNSTSFSTSQIGQAAVAVQKNVDTKYDLPSSVTVGNKTVTNYQYLYLVSSATKNVANGNKSLITLKNVTKPSSTSETVSSCTFSYSEYLDIANRLNAYVAKYGKLPSYVSTSHGTMKYQSLIYMYSKIMAYYNVKKVLPKTVSVKSWYAQTLGPAATLNATLKYVKTLGSNKYGYVNLYGPYGNASSKNKVAVIVGVHAQEQQTHVAMLNAISKLSSSLKNVQIWVFRVVVYTQYQMDYTLSRGYGQTLAHNYVVPNIGTSFKLVVDTHGNRGTTQYTGYPNFVFAPLDNKISHDFATKLINSPYTNGDLKYHYLGDGTSPPMVTIPIANKGIPTIVYEQYENQANYAQVLYNHALEVVRAINAAFA
jgi:Pseudomurein-binding repeat